MKIQLSHEIKNDRYTEYIYESFDIQNKEKSNVIIDANLEHLPKDWNIGVIYGGSGSGKTTILKNFFKKEMDKSNFDNSISLISNFNWLDPKEATFLLSAMGLSSIPTWLRPFNTLSNGEQYRANLAYIVGSSKDGETILIDEYTSVVDRDVAKSMSNALKKYIRRTNKKIVLASCHFDIMEWLQPDWIYSPSKGRLEIASQLRQRPKIELSIFRCRYETWNLFKQHHYLTQDYNKAADSFCVTWNDKPIAFLGILEFPGLPTKSKRISRIVVLPDFQGLGIGVYLVEYFAKLYKTCNYDMYIRTMNPALGETLKKNNNWKSTGNGNTKGNEKFKIVLNRPSYGFKYIGEKSNDNLSIIKFKSEIYKDVAQNQISLF